MAQSQFNSPRDVVAEELKNNTAQYTNQDQQKGYNIGTLEYPEGLRVKPDLQHYVAFYINVRDKTTGGKTNSNKDYYVGSREQKRLNEINRNRISVEGATAGAKTVRDNAGKLAAAGVVIGGIASGSIWKGAGMGLLETGVAAAGAAFAARTLVNMYESTPAIQFASGSTSRLKEVITLHVEEKPSVKYGANYGDHDMGAITGGLVEASMAQANGTLSKMVPELQQRVIAGLIKIPSLNPGSGGTFENLLQLSTRTKTNPFREVLFESVDYRTFSFRYKFYPKSAGETQKIKSIIEKFKIHMHPELSSHKLFYIYPSEFDIQYFFKDKENDYLHKFARCALTDMQVDYGGDQFHTFEDGAPVEIGLALTFRELEQMTSEGIKNYGY
jgi:hypothetical protein